MTSSTGCPEIQTTHNTLKHKYCVFQLEVNMFGFYSSTRRQLQDNLMIFKDLQISVSGCLLELYDILRMRLG